MLIGNVGSWVADRGWVVVIQGISDLVAIDVHRATSEVGAKGDQDRRGPHLQTMLNSEQTKRLFRITVPFAIK
jgi:hypothetical protein